ncbi:TetR/AcrR family transcriptional regulator [Actinokineospora sp. G85]|uniref:TetR/AcrR family transcriptional regulator n=1 Tax=Actinokineospora sp. G85 TaxID=3406626 RepID=UPI003C73FD18
MTEVRLEALLAADAVPLRPGPRAPGAQDNQRMRLLVAILQVVSETGYHDARLADVVQRAKVSRRTFYEHFTDKEECFLTAYGILSGMLSDRIGRLSGADWIGRVVAAVDVYHAAVTLSPAITRVFETEILRIKSGAERRRETYRKWADMLAGHVDEVDELQQLSPELWQALVAAFNEVVLLAVEDVVVLTAEAKRKLRADLFSLYIRIVAVPEHLAAQITARAGL